jgi:hypothetical protein
MYASLIEESNDIFHRYNKTDIREECETKYHVGKKKETGYKCKSAERRV